MPPEGQYYGYLFWWQYSAFIVDDYASVGIGIKAHPVIGSLLYDRFASTLKGFFRGTGASSGKSAIHFTVDHDRVEAELFVQGSDDAGRAVSCVQNDSKLVPQFQLISNVLCISFDRGRRVIISNLAAAGEEIAFYVKLHHFSFSIKETVAVFGPKADTVVFRWIVRC